MPKSHSKQFSLYNSGLVLSSVELLPNISASSPNRWPWQEEPSQVLLFSSCLLVVPHLLKSIPPILRATTSFSSSRDFIVHLSILIVLRIISNCNQNILLYWIFRREFTVRQSFTNTAPLFTSLFSENLSSPLLTDFSEKAVKFLVVIPFVTPS